MSPGHRLRVRGSKYTMERLRESLTVNLWTLSLALLNRGDLDYHLIMDQGQRRSQEVRTVSYFVFLLPI